MQELRRQRLIAGRGSELPGEADRDVFATAGLVVDDDEIAATIHRDNRIVGIQTVAALQEVLHLVDGGKAFRVDLKNSRACNDPTAEVLGDAGARPQRPVAPNCIDDARSAGFDARRGSHLRRVWRCRAIAADIEVDREQLRIGIGRIGDSPNRQRAGVGEASVDDIPDIVGAETLRCLEMEHTLAAGR